MKGRSGFRFVLVASDDDVYERDTLTGNGLLALIAASRLVELRS